jgi:hypothetical protein
MASIVKILDIGEGGCLEFYSCVVMGTYRIAWFAIGRRGLSVLEILDFRLADYSATGYGLRYPH